MFSNSPASASPPRPLVAIAASAAIAAGMTLLVGIEEARREGITLGQLGGYLAWPWWFGFGLFWGMLGGVLGIAVGFRSKRDSALIKGVAVGLLPFVLVLLLGPKSSGDCPADLKPPPGLLAYTLRALHPALPGGVAALLVSGGPVGKE